jgi:hypothetical protein
MFKKLWNWITAKKSLPIPIQSLTVQEVFNKVIELGYYTDKGKLEWSWMCNALDAMYCNNHITAKELSAALKEIQEYLDDSMYLNRLLIIKGLPSDFYARLAIYKDWKNRP